MTLSGGSIPLKKTNETEYHVVNLRTDGNIWESAGDIGI